MVGFWRQFEVDHFLFNNNIVGSKIDSRETFLSQESVLMLLLQLILIFMSSFT